jgi:lysophospholipase L1-like esterase
MSQEMVVPMRRYLARARNRALRPWGLLLLSLLAVVACGGDEDETPVLPGDAGVLEDAAWPAADVGAASERDAGRPVGSADGGGGAASDAGHATSLPDASALDAGTTADASASLDGGRDASATDDAGAMLLDGGVDAESVDAAAVDAAAPDAGAPGVRYVGRVDVRAANDARFSWSGTGVVARFVGSSLSVKLTGGRDYTVLIDGILRPKLVVASGTTKIADNLSTGAHTVELYRRVQGGGEGGVGASLFQGFSFGAGGMLLAPPAAPARRLEVIGDSISCGTGIEGANESCGLSADTENHYATYAAIAARQLGAELHTIAIGGKGLYCNYSDCPTSTDPVPTYFARTLREDASPAWDFARYQPDAVIVNLGTNDFNHDRPPTEAAFTSAYRSFLQRLRSSYPKAKILCSIGPMLWGDSLTTVRRSIANAVSSRVDGGDSDVSTFELAPQNKDQDGIGCGWHPNIKTHQKMAQALESALRAKLGW